MMIESNRIILFDSIKGHNFLCLGHTDRGLAKSTDIFNV